jgi:GT2 family glycosyltransferase
MSVPKPILSIIIPSYQRADLLDACLRSIHAVTNVVQLQIIVVDDASKNNSITQVAERYPQVTVVRQPRRQGFCAAVNTGLALAQADVVQVLNDDTEVEPNWYHAALERFAENSRLGSLAPLVLNCANPNLIDSAGDGYDRAGYAYSLGKGQTVTDEWLTPRSVLCASASAAFYRRSALLEVEGFPNEFIAYFDDLEVGLKLREAGYCCLYEPRCRVRHHGSASHGRTPGRRLTQQLACNEERLFCRHLGTRKRSKYLLRHSAVVMLKAVRRMREGMLIPFVMGRCQAWWEQLALVPGR